MLRWLLILAALTQLSAAPSSRTTTAPEPIVHRAPLVAIIANPARFDGRQVETSGYLLFDYGPEHLFVSRTDAEHFLILNGLAVRGPEEMDRASIARLDGKVVYVRGLYRWGPSGHLGQSRGEIIADQILVEPPLHVLNILYRRPVRLPGPALYLPLPWLWIMALLAAATAILAFQHWRARSGKGRQPDVWIWWGFCAVWAVFSVIEILDALPVAQLARLDKPGWWRLALLLLALGVVGMLGMCWSAIKKRRSLCLMFMALQFVMPSAREFVRLDTWPAQLTYPFEPIVDLGEWERTGPPPPPRQVRSDWVARSWENLKADGDQP